MELDATIFTLVGFIVGVVVEALKPIKRFNAAYSGIVALALGAALGAAFSYEAGLAWSAGIVSGIAGAASAAGIYSALDAAKRARVDKSEAPGPANPTADREPHWSGQ